DRLLARPPERMQARVDHEPARPDATRLEHPEPLEAVVVQPELVGEPLRIECPALRRRGAGEKAAEAADWMEAGLFPLECVLQMVAGIRLVERRDRGLVQRPL